MSNPNSNTSFLRYVYPLQKTRLKSQNSETLEKPQIQISKLWVIQTPKHIIYMFIPCKKPDYNLKIVSHLNLCKIGVKISILRWLQNWVFWKYLTSDSITIHFWDLDHYSLRSVTYNHSINYKVPTIFYSLIFFSDGLLLTKKDKNKVPHLYIFFATSFKVKTRKKKITI